MMEPTPTPYDVRFTMFGIPIRVHPMFWLVTIIMGWNALAEHVAFLFIWIGCVFVSILIHELGHVWMGQAFGSDGHIILYGFGGLAIGSNQLESRWQRILVSFAGPLAGFVFLTLVLAFMWMSNPVMFPIYLTEIRLDLGLPMEAFDWLVHVPPEGLNERMFAPPNEFLYETVRILIFINLLWGLVNLLPIWPLDGGQISRDVCEGMWGSVGLSRALGLSMVFAGILAIHCVLTQMGRRLLPLPIGSLYAAILFGLLALQSWQMLQQLQVQRRDFSDDDY